MKETSKQQNSMPRKYKGKIILSPFPHECGTCVIAGKDHKKSEIIKLISLKDDTIEYVKMYEKPVVRTQVLGNKSLLIPELSFSFNPLSSQSLRKGEKCIYPLTAGWIHLWEWVKKNLYEDHEFILYCRYQRTILPYRFDGSSRYEIYGLIRRTLPPLYPELKSSALAELGIKAQVDQ